MSRGSVRAAGAATLVAAALVAAPAAGAEPAAIDRDRGTPTIKGDDAVAVTGANGTVAVAGLAARLGITHAEAIDGLAIDTLAGRDAVDASGLAANTIQLTTD